MARGGQTVSRWVHNPKIVSSTLTPVIKWTTSSDQVREVIASHGPVLKLGAKPN